MKKHKTLFIWLGAFVLTFLVATCLLNYFCYKRPFALKDPIKTIKTLIAIYPRAKKKLQIIKLLAIFFAPFAIYLVGLYIALDKHFRTSSRYDLRGNEKERETIKGSARWATEEELIACEYLTDYEEPNLPSLIFGQTMDAVVDAPTPFKTITKKKGWGIIGADIGKIQGKTPTVNHSIIIGATRSGKGVGTIIPTLLSCKDSVVVYDPAGENYDLTANYRKTLGVVQYFNPQDKNSTLTFNPLEWLRFDENNLLIDIENMCQILVKNTDPKAKFFDDSAREICRLYIEYVLLFFPKDKRNLYSVANFSNVIKSPSMFSYDALLYKKSLIKDREQLAKIEPFVEEARDRDVRIKALLKDKRGELEDEAEYNGEKRKISDEEVLSAVKKENKDLFKGEAPDNLLGLIDKIEYDLDMEEKILYITKENQWRQLLLTNAKSTISKLKVSGALKAEQTIGSIMLTLNTALVFFTNETIANLMKNSSFEAEDLTMRERPLSLYLSIPNQNTENCKTFIELFFTLIINCLSGGETEKDGDKLTSYAEYYKKYGKHTVLFLIDEFPQLGRMKCIELGIPFIGKYGVVFMLVTQNTSQLKAEYKEGANSIIDNMQIINIKRVGADEETSKWVSNLFGSKTVLLSSNSTSGSVFKPIESSSTSRGLQAEQRSLISPDEVARLPLSEQLIYVPGLNAVKCKKLQWFAEDIWKKRQSKKVAKEFVLEEVEDENKNSFSNIYGIDYKHEDDEDEDEGSDGGQSIIREPEPKIIDETKIEGLEKWTENWIKKKKEKEALDTEKELNSPSPSEDNDNFDPTEFMKDKSKNFNYFDELSTEPETPLEEDDDRWKDYESKDNEPSD